VKTDDSEQQEKIEILDHEKIIKRGPIYILHTLLNWVFLAECENPIWVSFRDRKAVKKMVCVFLTNTSGQIVADAVQAGKLDFLKNFQRPSNHISLHFTGFEASVASA